MDSVDVPCNRLPVSLFPGPGHFYQGTRPGEGTLLRLQTTPSWHTRVTNDRERTFWPYLGHTQFHEDSGLVSDKGFSIKRRVERQRIPPGTKFTTRYRWLYDRGPSVVYTTQLVIAWGSRTLSRTVWHPRVIYKHLTCLLAYHVLTWPLSL